MSWLTPLGFLGLTGLIALIIIYIIKPNYQNKIISSTFVWKLSLKYKKNKIPLSKLRNILLLLCQIFVIIVASIMLAQPYFAEEEQKEYNKKVYIIDASASMMSSTGLDETRFDKALYELEEDIDKTLKKENAEVSIIIAHDTAKFIVQQATAYSKGDITEALSALTADGKNPCTYGESDIEGALKLAEKITAFTPDVEVVLFTDMSYIDAGNVTVNNVAGDLDYNVAVLDVRMVKFDNRYSVEVDVVCYGANRSVTVYCNIEGTANATDENDIEDGITKVPTSFTIDATANLRDGVVTTIYIPEYSKDDFESELDYSETLLVDYPGLYNLVSYSNVSAWVEEEDNFATDDSFTLYGGEKPVLKILYSSNNPNNYFATAFRIIREKLKYRWDIKFEEFIYNPELGNEIPSSGYDIYIYEKYMPLIMPEDGICIISDPYTAPSGANFTVGSEKYLKELTSAYEDEEYKDHPIIKNLKPEDIQLTKYTEILNPDGSYLPLLYCGTEPILYATDKNETDQHIVLMPFSLNYSTLPIVLDFPLMMYNIIEYYAPSTMSNYAYDINESIKLDSRGEELSLIRPDGTVEIYTEFPISITPTVPGKYSTELIILGKEEPVYQNFFVKIPTSESNIVAEFDTLENPYFLEVEDSEEIQNKDILLYFAIALVTLLFAEWWLHTREQY